MKINVSTCNEFRPLRIEFVLENQNELDALGRLFNSTIVNDVLEDAGAPDTRMIWEKLRDAGAAVSPSLTGAIKTYAKNVP